MSRSLKLVEYQGDFGMTANHLVIQSPEPSPYS